MNALHNYKEDSEMKEVLSYMVKTLVERIKEKFAGNEIKETIANRTSDILQKWNN